MGTGKLNAGRNPTVPSIPSHPIPFSRFMLQPQESLPSESLLLDQEALAISCRNFFSFETLVCLFLYEKGNFMSRKS